VAERKNKTIEELVKAMMNDQNLSMFLWEEVAMTVVYVQNRSPHRILKNMTLEEAFSRKNPSVEHLRIFGCHVYIHVPKDKIKKLEPSGREEYSLVTVNHQKRIESMVQVNRRLK
jgi:hypothetical protein